MKRQPIDLHPDTLHKLRRTILLAAILTRPFGKRSESMSANVHEADQAMAEMEQDEDAR